MKSSREQKRFEEAKKRVQQVKKFYNNLILYVIFIGFLAGLNYYLNEWKNAWFLWAAFGWGIGVIFQATHVFRINPTYNKSWEERKVKKYMEEEDKDRQLWE